MHFEYLWFGLAILAFQLLLLTTYCVVTMVGNKIPESRRLRGKVAVLCFCVGAVCSLLASHGYSVMFIVGEKGVETCGTEKSGSGGKNLTISAR